MDAITYEILQILPFRIKLVLLDIFYEIFYTGDFTSVWLNTYLHFILKSDGKLVHPIALTSCVCKLFEKIIKLRLYWWLEDNNLIHSSQTGFRSKRYCRGNLTYLALNINEVSVKKQGTLAVFLDVKDAFPNVLSEILLNQVAKIS